jgi:hypothetical protein
MPCPSHPPWLDHSNRTWRRVQVMKLCIISENIILGFFISLLLSALILIVKLEWK